MDKPSNHFLYPPHAPSPKRQRVNGTNFASRDGSPDELAAISDVETPTYHHRTSSKNLSRDSVETPRRSYNGSPLEDSPDELGLDHTIHTFYRSNTWNRSLLLSASRHATPDAPSEISMLTPPQAPSSPATPIPAATPLPPPIEEARYLPYRPKMVLKGHRKGVAAVRFSPKGDMIASCCQ